MKAKRPRRPKTPRSPFPSADGSIPVADGLRRQLEALEWVSPDILQHGTRQPPAWVERAGELVLQAAMPAVVFDRKAPPTVRLGAALGRLNAADAWLNGELTLPISPTVEAQCDMALENLERIKLPPAQARAAQRMVKKLEACLAGRPRRRLAIARIVGTIARAPYAQSREFQHAYDRANQLPGDWLAGAWMSREAKLCVLLAWSWPAWQTAPSVSQLHRFFVRTFTPALVGDLKSFYRLCRKIGFRLRGRGRPRKKK